jgi:hypothetical protein
MRLKVIATILILGTIATIGCQDNPPPKVDQGGIIKIDLTQDIPEKPFVINSITGDLRLIKLEANSNSYIKYFNGFVGKKYIISINQDKVILFTPTGTYKCTITNFGKGPNDFIGIDGWDVDSEEKFLFFHDYGRTYINKFNLKTESFEDNLPFKNKVRITNLQLINDTSICILPYVYSGSEYLFYYQNLSGLITGGIKKEPTSHKGPWAGRSPVFSKDKDKSIFFHPSESDTVFKIIGNDLQPFISILNSEPQKKGNVTTGTNVAFHAICKNQIILRRTNFEIIQTDKTLGINSRKIEYLTFDTVQKVVSIINPFYLDYSGIRILCPTIVNFINDNQFVAVYQAVDFKNFMDEALKKELDSKKRSLIMRLNEETSENDNPLIIVGTLN